jgi:hypothetical protein
MSFDYFNVQRLTDTNWIATNVTGLQGLGWGDWSSLNNPTPAPFTVSGRFEYHDKDYNQNGFTGTFTDHPIRYATVEIWEDNGGPSNVRLGTTFTAADGTWSFVVPDNSDPSGRDIFVKVIADTAAGTVTNANGTTYVYTGPTVNNWQGGTMWYDASPLDGSNQAVRPSTDEYSAAFNILDQLVTGYQYLNNQSYNPGHVSVQYRSGIDGTDYAYNIDTIHIKNLSSNDDGYDDSVILHEYGHFAADIISYYQKVGGPHFWDSHISQALAWNEGWASFFSSVARNDPYFVDTFQGGSYYVNIESGTTNSSLNTNEFVHDDNEAAVAMVLWDIFDSTNGTQDSVTAGIDEILNIIHNPTYFSASTSDTLYDLYRGWRGLGYSNLDGVREILESRGIAYWPFVTSVSDSPDPVTTSGSVSLTANVLATISAVASVSFYRESNGTSGLQIGSGGDASVGTDTVASNGWSVSVNTAGLANGTYTYYALATDTAGDISATGANVHSTTNTVNGAVNHAPTISSNGSGNTASISVAENSSAVTTVTANDQDAGTVFTYSLSGGADLAKFQINGSTGALSFINVPNFEVPSSTAGSNSYVVQVRVADNGNPVLTDVQTITVNVTDVNDIAPLITTATMQSVAENNTFVAALTSTDVDTIGTNPASFSIIGGTDAAKFAISNGNLVFAAAPDFENPTDSDHDNVYVVQVTAFDGIHSTDRTISINVTNVDETTNHAPTITSNGGGNTAGISVAENSTAVTTVTASDQDGNALNYSLSGGADLSKFQINSTTGGLSFIKAPNFEVPSSAAGSNSYVVQVRVADNGNPILTDVQTITVNVTDVNDIAPLITTAATQSVAEDSTFVAALSSTDVDTVGTNPASFSIVGGNDAAKFTISNGNLLFAAAPDFENPTDSDHDNIYIVQVRASDGINGTDRTISVTVTDVNETLNHAPQINFSDGTTISATAGQSLAASGLFTGSDADYDTLSYYLYDGTAAANSGHFVVNGTVLLAEVAYSVSAAQLAQTSFVAGAAGVTDDLRVIAFDGQEYSGNGIYSRFQVKVPGHATPNDFNGDGRSDILWRNDAGAVATWDMNDGNLLSSNGLGVVPDNWKIAGTGDFNGDHKSDILWRNDAGAVAIWDMNDGTLVSSNPLGVVPDNWHIAGVGDFNGDDKADILWRNDAGAIATWDMNDGTLLSSNPLGVVPDNWKIAGTGDFNGDHKTDILWRNDTGPVAIWDMNDGTLLSSNSLGFVPANWHIAGTGDFNGDDKTDILWRNDAGAVAIWDMNDGTLLTSNPLGVVPANWKIASIGDYNGDHKSDILWRNDTGPVAIWDMDDGTLLSSNPLGSVPANWHIIA